MPLQAEHLDNQRVATANEDVLIDRVVPGEILVIAFGFVSWTTRPEFDFFGRLKKLEATSGCHINKILVRDSGNAWYHRKIEGLGEHVDETALRLRELVRDIAPSKIITIGQSMGGYAAIMYGLLLNARQIISFGPLSFLDTEQARLYNERRWLAVMRALEQTPAPSGYYDLAALCRARATAQTSMHIIFGTKPDQPNSTESVNLDAMHAQRLAAGGHCTLHPFPYSGHAVVQHLIDTRKINGLLAKLILDITLEPEPAPDIGADWKAWVAENLGLGGNPDELVEILQQHGFSYESSVAAVGGPH
jgi:hypothetical protein